MSKDLGGGAGRDAVHARHASLGTAVCCRGFFLPALGALCVMAWSPAAAAPRDIPTGVPAQGLSDQAPGSPSKALESLCRSRYVDDSKTCDQAKKQHGDRAAAACRASATQRYAACLRGAPAPPLSWWPGPQELDPPVTPASEFTWCAWIPLLCPESPPEGGPRPGHQPRPRPGPQPPIVPPLLPPMPVPIP